MLKMFEAPRPKGAGILTSLTGTCSGVVAKTEDPISVSVNSGAPSPTNRVEVALSAADNLIVNSCRQKYLKDCEESDVEIHPRPKDRGFLSPQLYKNIKKEIIMSQRNPNFLIYGGTGIYVLRYKSGTISFAQKLNADQIKDCMDNGLDVYWCDSGMGIANLYSVISGRRSSSSATLITERILKRCVDEYNIKYPERSERKITSRKNKS